MVAEHELSAAAAQRMEALLPELLGTLRARRRRARRRRAAVAAALLVLPALLSIPGRSAPVDSSREPVPAALARAPAAPAWVELRDDPSVLARCEVATVVRSAWFVDDDEMQALLLAAEKPAGLVRSGSRVFVSAAALDPWPSLAP